MPNPASLLIPLILCSGSTGLLAQQLDIDDVLAETIASDSNRGVRAQLVAVDSAALSSGLSAQIRSVAFQVGDRFEENDVLVEFDCDSLLAQQKIIESQRRVSEINLQINQRLLELNNVGAQELALTQAEFDKASAQMDVIASELRQCVVHAPFSGRVVERSANPFEYVSEGAGLLEIVSESSLEVLVAAPSNWLGWLDIGAPFELSVEELNDTFLGTVVRLGGRVDPVSQTVLVWGKLSNPSQRLLPGMSGDIQFKETP